MSTTVEGKLGRGESRSPKKLASQEETLRWVYPVDFVMHPQADEINAIVKDKLAQLREAEGENYRFAGLILPGGAKFRQRLRVTAQFVEEACELLGVGLPMNWDGHVEVDEDDPRTWIEH